MSCTFSNWFKLSDKGSAGASGFHVNGWWFISSFLGGYLAGYMGSLYEKMSETSFFLMFSVMGAFIGIFFLVIEGRLTKMMVKTFRSH